MAVDQYGLEIDPDGDFTFSPDYNATECAALSPSNPNYVVWLDDETPDNSSPVSTLQHKYRLRQRHRRHQMIMLQPSEWVDVVQAMVDEGYAEAAATMKVMWLAWFLGFRDTPV